MRSPLYLFIFYITERFFSRDGNCKISRKKAEKVKKVSKIKPIKNIKNGRCLQFIVEL